MEEVTFSQGVITEQKCARHRPNVLLALLVLFSCIDPFAPDLLSVDYGILVIDGYFVPNDTTRIRLSRTATIDHPTATAPEPPALVRIEGNNGFAATLSLHDDQLYTMPPVNADVKEQYRLIVQTADGRRYESPYVPLKGATTIDSVVVHEDENREKVTFSTFSHDQQNDSRYYSYQYDETWNYTAAAYSIYRFENGEVVPRRTSSDLYNCWKTRRSHDIRLATTAQLSQDVVYDFPVLQMRQSDRRLYFAYSVNIRQYVLTPEAYSYWSIIKQNSHELGTLFDPLPGQPESNFKCTTDPVRPVVGFFSASEVTTKRILVKREDLRGPREPYQNDGYDNCNGFILSLEDVNEPNLAGLLIRDRAFDMFTFEMIGYIVYPAYCLDCRMQGGTTVSPDYWE